MTDQTTDERQKETLSEPEDPASRQSSVLKKMMNFLFKESDGDDLRHQLEAAVGIEYQDSNAFSEQERMMIANILRYGALRVEDVMVPRADIQAIDEGATLEELLLIFQAVGHSRIPVYRETLDDPTGMVHVKDLLSWVADHRGSETSQKKEAVPLKVIAGGMDQSADITTKKVTNIEGFNSHNSEYDLRIKDTNLIREVLFVPPSMPVMNLLLRMQSTHMHLALVVDEYGGTDGLVSIEDLVEEVVGEIEDEHDESSSDLIKGTLEKGLIVSARMPIEDLEAELNINLFPHDERDDDIDTLGGLVFSLCGRVPVRGEVITHPAGLEIEVLNADPRRIKALKMIRKTND